jgi:hypothetical protein
MVWLKEPLELLEEMEEMMLENVQQLLLDQMLSARGSAPTAGVQDRETQIVLAMASAALMDVLILVWMDQPPLFKLLTTAAQSPK